MSSPKKGILKHKNIVSEKGNVVWDEENVAECEAGKDATMKIDEPPTPYHNPDFDYSLLDEEMAETDLPLSPKSPPEFENRMFDRKDWQELNSNLEKTAEDRKNGISEWSESEESEEESESEEDSEEEKLRKEKFKSQRKNHYNEFQMAKLAAAKAMEEDEESSDEN